MMAWHRRYWGGWRHGRTAPIVMLAAALAGCPAPADENATEGDDETEGDDTTGGMMPTTMGPGPIS